MRTMKASSLDMMLAGSRIITALGPVDPGTPEEIVARVQALAACGGLGSRFGLIPSTASRTWRHDPDAFLQGVVHLPPCSADELPEVLTRRARSTCSSVPLWIGQAGRYLIVDMSHGLGDARLITMLNQILGERIPPQHVPRWAAPRLAVDPITVATRFFLRHPAQLSALVYSRVARTLTRESVGSVDANEEVEHVAWRRAPVAVAARCAGSTGRELWQYRDRLPARVSMASILFASLAGEIRSQGIDLADTVTVMYDCRRYLPTASAIFGNFASGVDLTLADPADPSGMHSAIVDAAVGGRPLAVLAVGGYVFHRQCRRDRGYVGPLRVPRRPRAKLVFSDVGDVFANSPMWTGHRGDRFYNALNEPVDPQSIVFTITRRGHDIDVTATFHENVFDPTLVQAALDRVLGVAQPHASRRAGS